MTVEIERKYHLPQVSASFIKFSHLRNVSKTIGSIPGVIAYISGKLGSTAFGTGHKEGSVLVIAAITLAAYSASSSLLFYLKV
jgi:hypothetical protein